MILKYVGQTVVDLLIMEPGSKTVDQQPKVP